MMTRVGPGLIASRGLTDSWLWGRHRVSYG
jgi:hypothetical protein